MMWVSWSPRKWSTADHAYIGSPLYLHHLLWLRVVVAAATTVRVWLAPSTFRLLDLYSKLRGSRCTLWISVWIYSIQRCERGFFHCLSLSWLGPARWAEAPSYFNFLNDERMCRAHRITMINLGLLLLNLSSMVAERFCSFKSSAEPLSYHAE